MTSRALLSPAQQEELEQALQAPPLPMAGFGVVRRWHSGLLTKPDGREFIHNVDGITCNGSTTVGNDPVLAIPMLMQRLKLPLKKLAPAN